MPDQEQILSALAALVGAVDDTGKILTRERHAESEKETIRLLRNLNNQVGHGWIINFISFEQRRDGQCEVLRTLKYSLEAFYPYEDRRADGANSTEKFRAMIEAVNDALIAESAWDLGFGNLVENLFPQAVEDFSVVRWGEGADSIITHYAVFELSVAVLVIL